MKKGNRSLPFFGLACLCFSLLPISAQEQPNLNDLPVLFEVPAMVDGAPTPGRRVKQVSPDWARSSVYHALYLPTDWKAGRAWPVILEYPGNGGYSNQFGDVSNGTVEACEMGYGLSQGKGFIWVSMPFIHKTEEIALQWWDVELTKRYCIETIREICRRFNGDPDRIILAGFSRGAIACNYIGLHDDEIAQLWCGMICHSHYEGEFKHPATDEKKWPERLVRLGERPQFISQEISVKPIVAAIQSTSFRGNLTFKTLPFKNHSVRWTRCDLPIRTSAVQWLSQFSNVNSNE